MEKEGYYWKDGKWEPDRRSGKDRRNDARGGRRKTDSQEPRYLSGQNRSSVTSELFEDQKSVMLFDFEAGLALCGGDQNAYEKTLRYFLDRTETVLDCIYESNKVDFDVYESLIRLIRSDFEKIAASRLATMALVLEKAAKYRQRTVIEEDHDVFVALSYLLCIEVRTALDSLTAQASADMDAKAATS